jgi:hypothetical protein
MGLGSPVQAQLQRVVPRLSRAEENHAKHLLSKSN